MYCYKCGKELPAGAVFCPFCGTKQGAAAADPETPVQAQVPAADPVAEKLHAQFEQIIFRRVLDAYMDRDSVDAEALYRSAEAYRFDEAAVDRTVAGFQEKLEQFDQYLTKRILGGELRTLTVTEALQDEALRYGQAIGLQEEDGEEILASFLQAHEVEEKHDGLQKLLAWFAVNGQWDVAGLPDDVRPLIGEEAEQLQAAVNELETELRRLHKASGKMELSEKDMRKLQALAESWALRRTSTWARPSPRWSARTATSPASRTASSRSSGKRRASCLPRAGCTAFPPGTQRFLASRWCFRAAILSSRT